MKYKITIAALVAILTSASSWLYDSYTSPVYQQKNYHNLFSSFGRADIYAMWTKIMLGDENGVIDMKQVMRTREAVASHSSEKGSADWLFWDELGPNFVGGRTRSIIRDNQAGNESIIYAGSVAGGVFVSYNFGEKWYGYSANMTNLNIGDMAQTANGTLFVGTGPGHDGSFGVGKLSSSGFRGDGLFRRSVDGTGKLTYTRIFGPSSSAPNQYSAFNRVIGHPTDANKLYCGTNSGLMVSANAQATSPTFFNGIIIGGNSVTSEIDDIAITPDGSTLYVAAGSTIYRLRDNGGSNVEYDSIITFTVGNGGVERMSLALSPENPNVIYAAIASNGSGTGCTFGVFQTRNGGATWVNIGPGGGSWDPYLSQNCQGGWDNCVAVFPNDPGKIILGGVSLWSWTESKTKPGTGGWSQLALTMGGGLTDTNYVHADKHRIMIVDSATIFIASDGGIAKSLDGGRTWGQNNNGYNVTQFYSVTAAFSVDLDSLGIGESELVAGGTQDNGTQLIGINFSRPDQAFEVLGGDGFDCDISNLANLLFATIYNGNVQRLTQGGAASTFWDSELENLCGTGCGPFYTRIAYWESPYVEETGDSVQYFAHGNINAGDTILYSAATGSVPMAWPAPKNLVDGDSLLLPDFTQTKLAFAAGASGASNRIYICRDGANLNTISPRWDLVADNQNSYPDNLTQSIFCMSFSADGNHLYLGSEGGGIYRVDNLLYGLDSASTDIRSSLSVLTCTKIAQISASYITSIAVDPNDANNIVVTVPGYSTGGKVWRINNAATCLSGQASVVNIGTNLPSGIPVYCSVISAHDKNTVLIGTEYGVYATADAFAGGIPAWHESYGLPKMAIYDMMQQTTQYLYGEGNIPVIVNKHYKHIYIGTHGRGFWKSSSLVGLPEEDKGNDRNARKEAASMKLYPNPVSGVALLEANLPASGQVNIDVYDLSGKVAASIKPGIMPKGKSRIEFNAGHLPNGTYVMMLKSGEEVLTTKFVVLK